MRLLLDTHIFLWYITNDHRLSPKVASAVTDATNEVYLSVVSVWETLVKYQLGRLKLPSPADEYLRKRQEQHRIVSLPLDAAATSHLLKLPPHHRDPFDRMLVCQAIHHDLTIVTSDEQVEKYPVRTFPSGSLT
jgi:PIN domain nuclease of toxin-antitoxin system